MQNSMIDALIAAHADRHEVVAIHGDHDGRISSLRLDPA
jgi:predicted nucleic acid-binding protein